MEGIFPSCLKTGRVVPIFKSGKKDQLTNYRPIITLSVLAKNFEKLAHKRMMYFISRFNLLNTNQLWCLAAQNTSVALTEFSDKAYDAINQNRVLFTVFLGFSKAFDTVDDEILLKILYYYGFNMLKLNSNVHLLWIQR